ncbi:hypothetical protein Tco_0606058 [Tanacetum coccineum]
MSTPVFVNPESSTQADGAQSSRVPVSLPADPYEAIRQAYLDGTNTKDDSYDEEIEESMDSDSVSEDAEDEGPTTEDKDPAAEDEGLTTGVKGPDDEGHSVESDGLGLEEEEAASGGQQHAAPVVGTVVSAPLGLGYGVLRRHELALEEGDVYSTFEVGQGSGSAPESERPERVSAFKQPKLTTWTDPEDGMIYIDIPDYPPPAPPVQTPPSPEWTSGSLPISPSHSDVPSPISSPMIPLTVPSPVATPAAVETEGFLTELGAQVEMQGGLIRDHAVRLEELSPALFERYDKDIGELFTRSGAVREEIFSQRYRFRSLEYEQERVAVTFGAIWRPVLALEAWAGQTDAQRAALWHAISDVQGENRDLRLQLAEERRARLELAEVVDGMRRGQEPRGGDMIGRNRPWTITESNRKSYGVRFGNLIIRLTVCVKSKVCDWYWKRKDVTQGDWVEMFVVLNYVKFLTCKVSVNLSFINVNYKVYDLVSCAMNGIVASRVSALTGCDTCNAHTAPHHQQRNRCGDVRDEEGCGVRKWRGFGDMWEEGERRRLGIVAEDVRDALKERI